MRRPLIAVVALCSATGALRVGPRSLAHGAVRRAAAAVSVATDTGFGSAMPDDLNLLETLLYDAVQREDYAAAAELRDRIGWLSGARGGDTDWRELGLPEWLSDWLGRLGYSWGTRVQVQALRGLTEISGGQTRHRDAAIVAPTGSGKTLAYLLPLLRRFSEDLLQEAPAAPGHERVASPLSPPPVQEDLSRHLATAIDGGRTDRTATPDAMPRPVAMIVVPSRELGVQAPRASRAATGVAAPSARRSGASTVLKLGPLLANHSPTSPASPSGARHTTRPGRALDMPWTCPCRCRCSRTGCLAARRATRPCSPSRPRAATSRATLRTCSPTPARAESRLPIR